MNIKRHLSFTTLRKILSAQFQQTDDHRQQGKFELRDCLVSAFAMMLFQDPSLCAFQRLYDEKFTSREEFWNQLRCTFRILLFRDREHMFTYLLNPPLLQPPSLQSL